jgi:hypothetical protein
MQFTLTIELGNDAMSDPGDIADALETTADTLRMYGFSEGIIYSTIVDENGNTVGKWEVTQTAAEEARDARLLLGDFCELVKQGRYTDSVIAQHVRDLLGIVAPLQRQPEPF